MIEAFFVAVVVFAVYVIYIIVVQPSKAASRAAELKPKSKPKAAKPAKAAPKPAAKAAVKPAAKPAAKAPAKPSSPAKVSVETTAQAATVLRDPKTGDTANVPNNYRFAKRWIKDALVAEGLLDKIYKNNELDDAASKKVKDAIAKLATVKKYQG